MEDGYFCILPEALQFGYGVIEQGGVSSAIGVHFAAFSRTLKSQGPAYKFLQVFKVKVVQTILETAHGINRYYILFFKVNKVARIWPSLRWLSSNRSIQK
jgi:hypothetical protein